MSAPAIDYTPPRTDAEKLEMAKAATGWVNQNRALRQQTAIDSMPAHLRKIFHEHGANAVVMIPTRMLLPYTQGQDPRLFFGSYAFESDFIPPPRHLRWE